MKASFARFTVGQNVMFEDDLAGEDAENIFTVMEKKAKRRRNKRAKMQWRLSNRSGPSRRR